MTDVVNETQECRVYEHDEWFTLIDYVTFLKHRKAYDFADERAKGLKVLDFGCGSGYGSSLLAKNAASVDGVDASSPAIAHCLEHYDMPNLTYHKIPPNTTLPFEDNSFDVVISFQVIEHMPDVQAYLRLLKRVLRPGGTLLITTPNRAHRLWPFQMNWQPAHFREYSVKTLRRELAPEFGDAELLGIYGTEEVNQIYYDHYHKSMLQAYIVLPMRIYGRKLLGDDAFNRVRNRFGLGYQVPPNPLPESELQRFTTDDIFIADDLVTAQDFMAVCRKPE